MLARSKSAAALQGLGYPVVAATYFYLLTRLLQLPFTPPYQVVVLLALLFSFLALHRVDIATPWNLSRAQSAGAKILLGWFWVVGSMLFIGLLFASEAQALDRRLMLLWFTTTPLALLLVHLPVRWSTQGFMGVGNKRTAVVIFANESARVLTSKLQHSEMFELKGYFDDRDDDRTGGGIPGLQYLGKARVAAQYVQDHGVEVVFVVLPDAGARRAVNVLDEFGDTTASLYYVPDFFVFSILNAQLGEVEGVPVLQVAETPFFGVDGLFKRLFDVAFSCFALVMIAPFMLAIALAVKLSSPGPVFFKQKRYGLSGKRFWVYKFRSMVVNAPDADKRQATKDDDRITRVGRFIRKTSLDELPQFLNVIKGEMSVVGPRPHTVAHNEHYRREVRQYMLRHKVKPGVTGWAQVNGLRGETANIERMEERIRFDLEYIRNWSLWSDVKIIFMTVWMVAKGDNNAY